MHLKSLASLAFAVVVLAGFAAPADAALSRPLRDDRRISVTGGEVIVEGDVVNGPVVSVDGPVIVDGTVNDNVYIGNGGLDVSGEVNGDILVVHGNVLITGRVDGDVIALDGRITTRDGSQVTGDVRSRREPNVAPGTVRGDVKKLNVGNLWGGILLVFLIFLWVAVTVSVALFGLLFVLLFPRAADATAAAGRRFWPTIGWGALVGIVGPILGVLLLATIVGIPFGLGVISAFNVLAPLGYVASSLILGRVMVKGTSTGARVGAFFAGFGILRVVALIPGIGFIVWFLTCLYGLGALVQAAWRAGRLGPESPQITPPDDEAPTRWETADATTTPAAPTGMDAPTTADAATNPDAPVTRPPD
jgi:cytoskeletal protein CcmA (bactofilin family)